MSDWLTRYDHSCSLKEFSRELFVCRYASKGGKSIVRSIVKALMSGVAAGAVMAALAEYGYSGEMWKKVVDAATAQIESSGSVDTNSLENMVQPESLKWKSMDVPKTDRQVKDENQAPSQPQTVPADMDYGSMFDYISNSEGLRLHAYEDVNGYLTIGIGHLLEGDDRTTFHALFGDSLDYDDVVSGKTPITKDQAKALFERDVQGKLADARRIVPTFDSLKQETKNAIVDALYRGDLGPNTIKLINAGKWKEAALEYLNHAEFKKIKEAVEKGGTNGFSIFWRMNRNSAALSAQAD
jgi:GH24 family phage-related lysozyme (muramidase)